MEDFSFKKFFDERTQKVVAVSALTVIILLAIAGGIAWHYRARIFKTFAAGYAQTLTENQTSPGAQSIAGASAGLPDTTLPAVFSDQQLVENAVQSANPAVVAITVSEKESDISSQNQDQDQDTNPFDQFFGNGGSDGFNFFQLPTTPNDNSNGDDDNNSSGTGGSQEQEVGAGSGFIVSSDGLIVTNKHVVADTNAEYEVYLSNGKQYTATVLARDSVLDVAIIKIDAVGLPYLSLGDSDNLKLGQSVIAIGNALGQFQNTVSVGVVSGLSRSIVAGEEDGSDSEALDQVIQTDAAINPGNSGGPLLDLSGHVIGVDTAIVQGSENIGFALPIDSIKTVISSVEQTGKIIRPYLGLRYEVITPDMQTANNLSVDYGALVTAGPNTNDLAVIPGSPADKAGIVENDIILDVNGQKLDQDHDLAQIIREMSVGDKVTLTLLDKGVQKTVVVTLEAAPQGE